MSKLLALKAVPYAVALVLSVGEIPSRLIAFRHRQHVPKAQISFAVRWCKVAETVGYPFLVLFYALVQVAELGEDDKAFRIPAVWLMAGGAVYAVLILAVLWFFGSDLHDENALPRVRFLKKELSFDAMVVIAKMVGVLFPAVLELSLTAHALSRV